MSIDSAFSHKYPSPLAVYDGKQLPELPTGVNSDGKSLDNGPRPQGPTSECYKQHPAPIRTIKEGNSFDFHSNGDEAKYAKELHERIRREFPEVPRPRSLSSPWPGSVYIAQMRIYKFWDRPVGPHPVPMFEVNTFTPIETGALFGFLTVWRGPLSVLIHPNTDDELRDHTELCAWIGEKWPIDTSFLKRGPH